MTSHPSAVGFIGWRGMVGSVLMDRMRAEHDFAGLDPVFFSTSNAGGEAPAVEGLGDTGNGLTDRGLGSSSQPTR